MNVLERVASLRDTLEFCRNTGEWFLLSEVWRPLGIEAQAQANEHVRGDEAFTEKIECASACFLDAIDFDAIELTRQLGARL
jgi:hypothetical protein